MIPKANQRAGGQQLATHLMNEFDNDRVELAEVRGAVAPDLHGAFAEWRAQAGATKCRKYLYSLSINPDNRQRPVTREEYYDFIARVEKTLDLVDQPRAVVFHVKYGREHSHVVWSRIDLDRMKAVQLSHDRQKLRTVAQEFARDYGLQLPPGMRKNRGLERFNEHARAENLAEKQQEERSGIRKQDRIRDITEAWKQSDNTASFIRALEERGYLLARGARRAYVVVDRAGEIHSLARQIEGATTRQIRSRLAEYPLDRLPDAAKAQEFARRQRHAQAERERAAREREAGQQSAATPQQRRDALAQAHARRRAGLDKDRAALLQRQNTEREALIRAQRTGTEAVAAERLKKRPAGIMAFLTRITGIRALTAFRHARQDELRRETDRLQRDALSRRQRREVHEIDRRSRALNRIETRERRSLETLLRRERLHGHEIGARARQDRQQPERETTLSKHSTTQSRERETIREEFGRTAAGAKSRRGIIGRLRDVFSRHAAPEPEQTNGEKEDQDSRVPKAQRGRQEPAALTPAFNELAGQEEGEKRGDDDSLTARFKARAAQKRRQEEQEQKQDQKTSRGPGFRPGRRN